MMSDIRCEVGGQFSFTVDAGARLGQLDAIHGEWSGPTQDGVEPDHPGANLPITLDYHSPTSIGGSLYEVGGSVFVGSRPGTYLNYLAEVRDGAGRTVRTLPTFPAIEVIGYIPERE